MATKIKSNSVTWHEVQHDGNIKFGVRGAGEFLFKRDQTSLECRHEAELQGWVKRIINMAAISRDTDDGSSASPEEKYARMKRAADYYMAGATDWFMRQAAGPREDDAGLRLQGIMRAFECDQASAEAKVAGLAKLRNVDEKAALAEWAKTDKVISAILAIKTERAAKSALSADDVEAELAKMMAGDGA